MENVKEKETKRRFFRRTGLSRAQRSLDSSSPVPSHSPSFENNSMTALPSTAASTPNSVASAAGGGSSSNFGISNGSGGSGVSGRGSGAGGSLDENVINNKMEQHRRFMAAPRRARSADRFDGMRIAFNNSPGDEMLPRNFRSPQLVRNGGGTSVTDLGRPASQTPTMSMPSPPPPYSSAVTDITGPPSYRQAVAAMTAAAQAQVKAHPPPSSSATSQRYAMHMNRGTQSFDQGGAGIPAGGTLRSAASVPAFTDEVICNCSKCQVFQRPNEMGYGEYNDAVYMESQAFLMHEIMTDGMAFCSVM